MGTMFPRAAFIQKTAQLVHSLNLNYVHIHIAMATNFYCQHCNKGCATLIVIKNSMIMLCCDCRKTEMETCVSCIHCGKQLGPYMLDNKSVAQSAIPRIECATVCLNGQINGYVVVCFCCNSKDCDDKPCRLLKIEKMLNPLFPTVETIKFD